MQSSYKGLKLSYDYVKYSWVVVHESGAIIGYFTTIDNAKQFIDNLINNV